MSESGGATIDPSGTYRYSLWRKWDEDNLTMLRWVLLNPSTADAEQDDPTIRRCIGYAKSWGFGGMVVLNLFALRATDPKELKRTMRDPIGPDNDKWIDDVMLKGTFAVAGWGAGGALGGRGAAMHRLYPEMRCLGLTKDGHPRHPLYLPKTLCPEPWR